MWKKTKKIKNNITLDQINEWLKKDKEIPSLIGWKVKLDDLNQSFSDKVVYENNEEQNNDEWIKKDGNTVNQWNIEWTVTQATQTEVSTQDTEQSWTTQWTESISENSSTPNINSVENKRSGFFQIPEDADNTNNTEQKPEDHDFDNSTAGIEKTTQWNIALDNLGSNINTESMNTINVNSEKFQSTQSTIKISSKGNDSWDENDEKNNQLNWDSSLDLDWKWDWIDLWEIQIDDWSEKESNLFDLSGWSLYDSQKTNRVRTGKITVISVLISIIAIIVAVVCFFYNRFITTDLANPEDNRAYTFIETVKDFIWKYTNTSTDVIESVNLNWANWKTELDNLINSDLNYIQKKQILTTSVSNLSTNIIWKYGTLNWIRSDITQYGFFPKTLTNIISEDEPISSIQNSLVALEAIKFSSAISVFSYLDTFVSSLVQSLGLDKDAIQENIDKVTNRWESDINVYIKDCYLNPFESNYDCNYIWDFDAYYNNLKDNFNTKFFKELIKYTDARLEQSQIPSFSISFKEFNQNSNEITFDIEINTLKEDEAELTKKWILSPHIFIFKSLINSLRQSRFIVWDDISIKTLNVTPSTYIIWASEVNVNKSSNSFTVHIKKENAVEIDDFVYMDY